MISTDDPARRLVFVWKGPENFPFLFDARWSAYLAFAVLAPALMVVAWALTGWLELAMSGTPTWAVVILHFLLSVFLAVGASVLVIRIGGRRVSPTTPVRHHLVVLSREISAPRESGPATTVTGTGSVTWVEDLAARTTRTDQNVRFIPHHEEP